MPRPTGSRLPLSLPRRWIGDLMAVSGGLPLVTAERRMDVSPLVDGRSRLAAPPSWAAIFLKGYAAVAARSPALRRSYQRYPWPHLYEAAENLGSVAVAREYQGQPAVFFGLVAAPERQSLWELTDHLTNFKLRPVEDVHPFARLLRYSRYPLPVRRVLWWLGVHLSGRHRAKTVGTFGLSTVAGAGAGLANLVSPLSTALSYGPLDAGGRVTVRLTFDHRVLDGLTAAAALADLETVLRTELVAELRGLAGARLPVSGLSAAYAVAGRG